jgi:hypothetical protein
MGVVGGEKNRNERGKSEGEQQPWQEEKSDGHVLCAPLLKGLKDYTLS